MNKQLILINRESEGIIFLTLNRPEKRNALNIPLMRELCHHLEQASKDHSIRVVILHGDPVFCAGLDLHEAMDPAAEEESAQMISHILHAVYECPAVTIAAVQGAAIGGGAGLMAAFDLILAAETARIGFPEVKRGLVPAQIAPVLARRIGGGPLRELLLLGELIDANRAFALGLVNQVVPEQRLLSSVRLAAHEVLRAAPGAIRKTKRMLDLLYPTQFAEDLMKVMPFHMEARQSAEGQEGMRAFVEKRDPRW